MHLYYCCVLPDKEKMFCKLFYAGLIKLHCFDLQQQFHINHGVFCFLNKMLIMLSHVKNVDHSATQVAGLITVILKHDLSQVHFGQVQLLELVTRHTYCVFTTWFNACWCKVLASIDCWEMLLEARPVVVFSFLR